MGEGWTACWAACLAAGQTDSAASHCLLTCQTHAPSLPYHTRRPDGLTRPICFPTLMSGTHQLMVTSGMPERNVKGGEGGRGKLNGRDQMLYSQPTNQSIKRSISRLWNPAGQWRQSTRAGWLTQQQGGGNSPLGILPTCAM